MPEQYLHLPLSRLEPANPRRTKRAPGVPPPEDPRGHAVRLLRELARRQEAARLEEPGFDPRLLLRVEVVGASPEDFEAIGGLRVVSQEARSLVLLFATEAGLADFRHRLDQVAAGRRPTRQDLLFAVKGVSGWTRADRTGPALGREGVPPDGTFLVDVELWPLEQGRERAQMLDHFDRWCAEHGVAILDTVNQRAVILKRLRLESGPLDRLLELRDVRLVDLPPRYQLDVRLTHLPLATIGEVPPPPDDAEGVVVLDSGIATNHPVLRKAVGDAQSFLPDLGPEDECGHGTMVAGLALYGDVATRAETGRFVPELRLFSGRICDARNENNTGFVENHVVEAVRYFREHYGCRVFNLSFGDLRRPYTSGHVRGLAVVLDSLAREQGVLFTVAAGNFAGSDEGPTDWRREYPEYLLHEDARLIDPAPALNALTVGSLARYEVPRMGQRFPHDVGYQAIARADAPSPFSRSGPGPGGAIKPDVAEYGGNWHVEARARPDAARGSSDLGELSTWHAFVGGNLFGQDSGTSFAAPRVAHGAAHVFRLYPDASPDLVRALIVAHARQPPAALDAVGRDRAKALRLIGYGAPDWEAVRYSSEARVTLVSEQTIEADQSHFYEIPLPEDFFAPPLRRARSVTVALAHTPAVRTTRFEYRETALSFRVIRSHDLEQVVRTFRKTKREEREAALPETGKFFPSANQRDKGTVQAGTWEIGQVGRHWAGQRLFVVVTQKTAPWAKAGAAEEPYALVAVLADSAMERVRYYTQIQQLLRARVRM